VNMDIKKLFVRNVEENRYVFTIKENTTVIYVLEVEYARMERENLDVLIVEELKFVSMKNISNIAGFV